MRVRHKSPILPIAFVVFALLLIGMIPMYGMTHFTGVSISQPTEVGTATPALLVNNAGVSNMVEVRDASTPVFLIENGGSVDLGGLFQPSFADLTLSTAGQVLTPTYTVYALDTTAAISMTLAASADEGQLLILIGDDNNTITINDTNIRTSDGNAATLGQYDVIVWVYQDSEWLQVVKTADS